MRKLWITTDLMYYYGKTSKQVAKWREDGLKSTMLSGAYYYDYKDIVDYLKE